MRDPRVVGAALAAGAIGLALGLSTPALAHEASTIAHKINGSSIAKHSISGNRLKPHAVGTGQVKPLTFHRLTLQNGWKNSFANRPVSYAVDLQGVVRLRGAVFNGTVGTIAFVLPKPVRPSTPLYLVDHAAGTDIGDIVVSTNGKVLPRSGAGDEGNYSSFDGITYTVH
jgi:hypothetical protein